MFAIYTYLKKKNWNIPHVHFLLWSGHIFNVKVLMMEMHMAEFESHGIP